VLLLLRRRLLLLLLLSLLVLSTHYCRLTDATACCATADASVPPKHETWTLQPPPVTALSRAPMMVRCSRVYTMRIDHVHGAVACCVHWPLAERRVA
jgi:hypothetical protein